ncbi:MAG TPA: PadR family transcriptional regulator [Chloroflexota bacterium]|nr:PadR family transcriptional regulator [Chloroflexota bacterium]
METDGLVTQMRKGALEYCVLALLTDAPCYGLELVQALGRVDGMLTSEGTIYPLLGRLRRDGLVETEWRESESGPPRRYYRLTRHGLDALAAFKREWSIFRDAVDTILRGGESDDRTTRIGHHQRVSGTP